MNLVAILVGLDGAFQRFLLDPEMLDLSLIVAYHVLQSCVFVKVVIDLCFKLLSKGLKLRCFGLVGLFVCFVLL